MLDYITIDTTSVIKKEDIQLIQMLMRLMDCNKQKGKSFKTRKHIKAVTKNLTKYKKVD